MLEWVRQLYDIEDRAHDWSVDARRELRAGEANPILGKIEAYLAELAPRALPKSSLAKAVTYARNQWEALRRYTDDDRLTIDNNVSERTLTSGPLGQWRSVVHGHLCLGACCVPFCSQSSTGTTFRELSGRTARRRQVS